MPRIFSLSHVSCPKWLMMSMYIYVHSTFNPTRAITKLRTLKKKPKPIATMASSRLLRTSKPLCFGSTSFSFSHHHSSMLSMKPGFAEGEKQSFKRCGERKSVVKAVAASETLSASKTKTERGVDLPSLLAHLKAAVSRCLKLTTRRKSWRLLVQMFIERAVIDCRFFTMLAVAGTLLGSLLCFVEGCFMILESYLHYFRAISHGSDQGHVMQLLIEAIDMFLVGTAMLTFGIGLHVMFVAPRGLSGKGSQLPESNFFGLFYLKKLPSWVGIESITQAKSKIGHAMMLILQVGVLDKFKRTPLVTGLDLACFAGAVFVSSACAFLLSRLAFGGTLQDGSQP